MGGRVPVSIKAGPSFSSLIAKSAFFAPFEGFVVTPFAVPPFFAIPFSTSPFSGGVFRVFGNFDIDESAAHLEFGKGLQDQVRELCIPIEKGATVVAVQIVNILRFQVP